MGQKVNPHGLRVGVIKDWDSRWYARPDKVGDLIVEDDKIRKYLKKRLYAAGVPTIEIERDSAQVRIFIHCSRPGVIIGKGGTEIEKLRQDVEKLIGKKVAISIVECAPPIRTPSSSPRTSPAAREAHRLPPCDEELDRPRDAYGRQGHQGLLRRPSRRR